jgi:hypothetical protein
MIPEILAFNIFIFLTVCDNSVIIFKENLNFYTSKNYSMKSISDNGIPFLQITTEIQPNPCIFVHSAHKVTSTH